MSAVEPTSPGNGPGKTLAEARKAQGLSAADVARQLKLSVAQVEALESGEYQQLPGPIFVRGFIRNYARIVRLDPGELLREAGEALPLAAPVAERASSPEIPFPGRARRRWPLVAGLGLVVTGLALYEFVWNEQPAETTLPAAQSGPATASPAQSAAAPAPASDLAPPIAPAQTEEKTPVAAVATAEVSVEAKGEKEPARKPGERQISLQFEDESWVEIRDRNEKVIFSQLNRPGTQQRVNGLPPFSVVVGNAQAVRLTFDAKPVDLGPYTKIDVARLILQ